MPKPRILISACLCGHICRYDAVRLDFPRFAAMEARGLALPVCPEVLGGLPTPRSCVELAHGRAVTRDGHDLTASFTDGAMRTLALAREHGIGMAILKDRSPSCGATHIHDGTFSGRLVPGQGITAELLCREGIILYSEADAPDCLG